MKEHFKIAFRFTVITTIIFGLLYPLCVTGLSYLFFRKQANGSLVTANGVVAGSSLIGQSFTSDKYFHSRPSSAGSGYDPTSSGGSNLGPTNKQLIDRVHTDVAKLQQENPGEAIPSDMVTSSGSGLDPDISPASAEFQIPRIAKARGVSTDELKALVLAHLKERQFGLFGEARINVLALNLDLDAKHPAPK
ncbi:MAG: potassium-transporting ATPase subunit KdpC [Candidatus Acidiferrum sp.]